MVRASECVKCGNELWVAKGICSKCGTPHDATEPEKKPAKKREAKPK